MTIRSRKDNIRTLVIDTITLLCKNSLPAEGGFSIEGTIGVSSLKDEDDVFLIPIKEIIKAVQKSSDSDSDATTNSYTSSRRKKRRRRSKENEIAVQKPLTPDPFNNVRLKIENQSDSDSGDLVMVKEEPSLAHQRQLQATQLNANESAALNDAVSNLSGLNQIQSFQPFPGWPSPQMLSPLHHHQQQQQHHHQQQQQHHQMMQQQKRQHTPQMQGFVQHPQTPQTPDNNESKFTHEDMKVIEQRVASTEGQFLTVRLIKRRISRYPTDFLVRTMKEYMTRPRDHPLFLGIYLEPPRTKVFYKCPPDLITDEALKHVNCTRELYTEMFNRVPKVQKWDKPEIQGRLLLSALESSPFINYYDTSTLKPQMEQPMMPAAVTETKDGMVLDLSVDSPLVQHQSKEENTPEEGEIRRPSNGDKHSSLAPLYAMANKLNIPQATERQGTNGHRREGTTDREGGKDSREGGKESREGGKDSREEGKEKLSAQAYAEMAIMNSMYHRTEDSREKTPDRD